MKAVIKKVLLITLSATLALGVCAASGYLIYSQISKNQNQTTFSIPSEDPLSKISKNLSNWFVNNSLRVSLQTSSPKNDLIEISQGTAWSWYYKWNDNDKNFVWYIMTNYHVVSGACRYIASLSNESSGINEYSYLINMPEKNYFNLEWNVWGTKTYQSVFETNGRPISAQIITDNNNSDIKLFSNNNNYNLDMALIKMTFSQNLTPYFENINNPLQNYLSNQNLYQENYNKGESIIVGNPANTGYLTGGLIESDNTWITFVHNLSGEEDEMIKQLKAPYQVTLRPYKNWRLNEGSSGSAIYQNKNFNNIDSLNGSIPSGIYWGGFTSTNTENSYFYPSYIPFIFNDEGIEYNIFNDFYLNWISNKI